MARKPKINEEAVAKLGAERLAALLVAEAARNKPLKQALQLALDGDESVAALASTIRKRLAAIRRATSYLSTAKSRELARELKRLHESVVTTIAEREPGEALALLWQFLDLHADVISRTQDHSGHMSAVFRDACEKTGAVAGKAHVAPAYLAEEVFTRLMDNYYGILDDLLPGMSEALGDAGLTALRTRFERARDDRIAENKAADLPDAPGEMVVDGVRMYSLGRSSYDYVLVSIKRHLCEIADLSDDVDAFIAAHDQRDLKTPNVATEIARRLFAAQRLDEALVALDTGTPPDNGPVHEREIDWCRVRADVLEALARVDEAQSLRWSVFERHLDAEALRTYLKALPDFDDIEAEERALEAVAAYDDVHQALAFLVAWPALATAAELVELRFDTIDGDRYRLLTHAAVALEGKHPLAAVLLRRAMIDFSLTRARTSRYRHAARHMMEIASADAMIADYGAYETHDAFLARIQLEHGRKQGFWRRVAEVAG